jgi:ribosome-binding factor A
VSSPRKYPRTARLNESLLEVLAEELERLSDPRLELVTITGVDVSRDLSRARVYYSTLGKETTAQRPVGSGARSRPGEEETTAQRPVGSGARSRPGEEETTAQRLGGSGARSRPGQDETTNATGRVAGDAAAGLEAASSHLRGEIGRQLRIRQVPALVFQPDPGILAGQRIDEILRGEVALEDDEEMR